MNLTNLQSWAAPLLTPAAPAIILMNHSYSSLIGDGALQVVAVAGSVASGVGLECAGALSFAMGLIALKRRNWTAAAMAGVGVIGYASLMLMGVSTGADWMSFAPFVGGSLVAFMAVAVKSELDFSQAQEKKAADEKAEAQRLKIAELDAERRALNAQARLAKMDTASIQSGIQSIQPDTADTIQVSALGTRIQEYIQAHPGESDRAVAEACQTTHRTVGIWRRKMVDHAA